MPLRPSELLIPDHNQQKTTIKEQKPVAALSLSSVAGHAEPSTLRSLPQTKSNVLDASKLPQSFPDRLAFIQKQKELEESRAFARSCVRALKVSNEVHLNCSCRTNPCLSDKESLAVSVSE